MTSATPIRAGDDLDLLLPGCTPAEREQRERLRGARNAATALIASTESADARALAWMVVETATAWLYAPASGGTLNSINRYVVRLLTVAVNAEELHDEGILA